MKMKFFNFPLKISSEILKLNNYLIVYRKTFLVYTYKYRFLDILLWLFLQAYGTLIRSHTVYGMLGRSVDLDQVMLQL